MYDDCSDRILLFHKTLDESKELTEKYPVTEPVSEVDTFEEANLLSSKCKDGMQAPVLDFDYPIEVYPSSQLGHYHLYINKKIPWGNYANILSALSSAGLIESGYADASISKGYSSVRPIGVIKPNAPAGVEVLVENAKLRQENYKLKQERIHLLKLVEEHLQLL